MTRARFGPRAPVAIMADSWGVELDVLSKPSVPFEHVGDFAIVDICGPLAQRSEIFFDSYEDIERRFDAAIDSPANSVMLRINSPGGMVAGCFELVDHIRRQSLAAGKRVVAYVDGLAASAAYALACAAETIYVPATGIVGSIGCIQVAIDTTAADRQMGVAFDIIASGARKADGNPHLPMTEDGRQAFQSAVDSMASTFFASVAMTRPLSAEEIQAYQAGVFVGEQAVSAKLADMVRSLGELLSSGAGSSRGAGAEIKMDEDKKARAALKAIAEGDDEKMAAKAKKALAALDDEGVEEKKDDEKKSEAKAEDEAPPPSEKEDKKDEDKGADAKAVMALAKQVQTLTAERAAEKEAVERTALMASRPDLAPEVVTFLDGQPLKAVREAVKTFPRGPVRGQVAAARAALGVSPKEAAKEEVHLDNEDDRTAMRRRMGLATGTAMVRHEGNKSHFGAMTRDQARELLTKKEGAR